MGGEGVQREGGVAVAGRRDPGAGAVRSQPHGGAGCRSGGFQRPLGQDESSGQPGLSFFALIRLNGSPGQCGGLGLEHTAPTEGSQSPPPLCHQAEVSAVAEGGSRPGGFSPAAMILLRASWPPRSRRSMGDVQRWVA